MNVFSHLPAIAQSQLRSGQLQLDYGCIIVEFTSHHFLALSLMDTKFRQYFTQSASAALSSP